MLANFLHQLVMISTTFGQHLCSDGMDFSNDRILVEWFRHFQKTPPA